MERKTFTHAMGLASSTSRHSFSCVVAAAKSHHKLAEAYFRNNCRNEKRFYSPIWVNNLEYMRRANAIRPYNIGDFPASS